MSLASGTRLGPYEILGPLGAGGMGEVYRARDSRLGRDVAIKVLPSHLSDNPELKQRFEREAKAISQLTHPHICTLHDIGSENGVDFLVMELLEGQSLAERLEKGALPTEQVLKAGIEIADALDKAHRHGIIHRDLKPGNVMLTKSGVKLLDFGLAKVAAAEKAPSDLSSLPTQGAPSRPLTEKGTIMGTFQYMAPEQLEGKDADARSDIFALGAVLHEMATEKKAFSGASRASLIGAIMNTEPPPISSIQPLTPPALDRVVKTCLAKDPDERWQSAHDVVCELRFIAEGASQAGMPALAQRRRGLERAGWTLAAVFAALSMILAVAYIPRAPKTWRAVRATLLPPEGWSFLPYSEAQLSPDGSRLAFVARDAMGKTLLWVRALDSLTAQPLEGTDQARDPFWSPDGRFLGFFAQGKLQKIGASGGPSETLADAINPAGGTWSRDGVIVFCPNSRGGLHRVAATGGRPTPVTSVDPSREEVGHVGPRFLPDGRHFVYLAVSPQMQARALYVASLDSKEAKLLVSADSNPVYTREGYLLFLRGTRLMAQAFDPGRLEVRGEPTEVTPGVEHTPFRNRAIVSVSDSGVLCYYSGAPARSQFVWVDRAGKPLGSVGSAAAAYDSFRLSPDGRTLAVELPDALGMRDVWLIELARGVTTRLTFDPSEDFDPAWSPDAQRIVFCSGRRGHSDIWQKLASPAASDELLLESTDRKLVDDWSPDGRFVLYVLMNQTIRGDLWLLPMAGDRKPVPFLETPFRKGVGVFSPDGRYVAYASDESGQDEVFVQTFPASRRGWQISAGGGAFPKWRRDGRELFYLDGRKLMAVAVKGTPSFEAGVPSLLFELPAVLQPGWVRDLYEVSADGQRFLIRVPATTAAPSLMTLVLNWTAELKQ